MNELIFRPRGCRFFSHVLLGAMLMAFGACRSHAATETWDGGHSSANEWFANLNWVDNTAPVDFDDLVFAGTTGLSHSSYGNLGGADGDFDIQRITFDATAGAFVIANGGGGTHKLHGDITNNDADLQTLNFPFQLNANVLIRATSGDITIGGVISQDGSNRKITKVDANTLTLNAANTYAGGTAIGSSGGGLTGGTLSITDSSALGSGGVTFEQGGALDLGVDGLNVGNWIGWYNWGGGPRKIQLDLSGANSGTLSGNNMEVRNGGVNVFEIGTDDTLTVSRNLVNTHGSFVDSGIIKTNAGTLVLSGANTFRGPTRVKQGQVDLGDGGTAGTLNTHSANDIIIDAGATFAVNQSDTVTQGTDFSADPISGAGAFEQNGSGTTTLNIINTYSGTTTVNGGILELIKPGGHKWYANGALHINNGSTLRLGRNPVAQLYFFDSKSFNYGSSGGSTIELVGNAGIVFRNDNTVTTTGGSENIFTNSSINTDSGGTEGTTTFNVADGTDSTDLTVATSFSNAGAIEKSGSGTMAFTVNQSYTGPTTISAGWLELGDGGTAGALSTSSSITNHGVFVVNQSDTVIQGTDFSGDPIVGSGNVMQIGSTGRLVLNAANTHSGGTRIGRLDVAWGGTQSTEAGGTIEILHSSALGTGEVRLEQAGTLELGVSGLSIANTVSVPNWTGAAKAIQLDEAGTTTGTMSGNVWLQNQSVGSFDVNVGADDTLTMSGAFYHGGAGGVGIDKLGDGTLILTGDSQNFSVNKTVGDARIYAGTVQLGDGGTAGTMATAESISISAGATFAVDQSDTVTQGTDFSASALTGAGAFEQNGSGTTVFNTDSTYTGGTTVNDGELHLDSGDNTLASGSSLTIDGGTVRLGPTVDGNNIFGSGPLTISNGGVLTDDTAGGNVHSINSGMTFTNGGTLASIGGSPSATFGNYFVNGDVTVSGNAAATISADQISVNGPRVFSVADVTGDASRDLTVSSVIKNWGANVVQVNKSGAGTMALTAANTFTGTTTVNDGILELAGTLAGGGLVTIDGATMELTGAGHNRIGIRAFLIQNGGILTDDLASGYVQSIGTVTINDGGTLTSDAGTTGSANFGNFLLTGGLNVTGTGLATISANRIGFNFGQTVTVADTVAGAGTDLLVTSDIRWDRVGTVTKAGPGTMELQANSSSDTSPWNVDAGTLRVNNSAGTATGSGAVTVKAGATLGGTGSMNGLVTLNSTGHIAPGNSIGTITMSGGLTLDDGSILDIEADSLGAADKIVVDGGTFTGSSSADGVTLNVTFSGTPQQGAYTLIDWSAASGESSVDLTDFDLILTGPTSGMLDLVIDNQQLLLTVVHSSVFTFK